MKNLFIVLLALSPLSLLAQSEVSVSNDIELCVGKAYAEIMKSETVKERLEKALSESDFALTNEIALRAGNLASFVCEQ